jgi:aspartyl aminopeptidase
MDPLTILAALGPLAVDLGKSLIGRFIQTDVYKPTNIAEYTQMRQTDLQMFEAMNNAGGGGTTYPWVESIVRLMRPTVGAVVLGTWAFMQVTGHDAPAVNNFASAVGFYLFGDRTLFYSQKSNAK